MLLSIHTHGALSRANSEMRSYRLSSKEKPLSPHSRVAGFLLQYSQTSSAPTLADHHTTQCKWVRSGVLKKPTATLRAKQGGLSILGHIPRAQTFYFIVVAFLYGDPELEN